MSREIVDIANSLEETLVYDKTRTSVFLIGSRGSSGAMAPHALLSDTDLLIIAECATFDDYVRNIEQAIKASQKLNSLLPDSVDIFLLNKRFISFYSSYLSVLTATGNLGGTATIHGPGINQPNRETSLAEKRLSKEIYRAQALMMSRECQETFPVADTTKARQVAKQLIRLLKVFICALTPVEKLRKTEESLLSIKSLALLKQEVEVLIDGEIPIDEAFTVALDTEGISDWPSWMIAQEKLAHWLMSAEAALLVSDITERRLYEGIVSTRNMLYLKLRNIFFEKDTLLRQELISEYADKASTILIRLGFADTAALLDFTTDTTPPIVQQSYDILVEHLQGSKPDVECLAASIILLEYAFEYSIGRGIQINE